MNQKELKRLSRGDLLEMMLSLSKENDQLLKELHRLKSELADRTLTVENSSSLAEAALNLNGVFQAAQEACDQYSLNIRHRADAVLAQAQEKLDDAEKRSQEILSGANSRAEEIVAQARAQAKQMLEDAQERIQAREKQYSWITELMENSEEV